VMPRTSSRIAAREIVGRIGVIINHKANEIWKQKNARFSFVDFIDDAKVTDALFATSREFGRDPAEWRRYMAPWDSPIWTTKGCLSRGLTG